MLWNRITTVACLLATVHLLGFAADVAAAKLDKSKLEQFIRYTEGYTSIVKIDIGNAEASPFKGYERLPVHLSMGAQKIDKVYFVSADGQILNREPARRSVRRMQK